MSSQPSQQRRAINYPQQQSRLQIQFEQSANKEQLSILLITWNLMGTLPSEASVVQLLHGDRIKESDLIVVGTQECQRTLFASFFIQSKDKWESLLLNQISMEGFVKVESHVLQGLHLIVFAHSEKYLYLKDKKKDSIKTGFCNMVGNKGGVSVEFIVNDTKLTFVNVHLAANQQEIQNRNISLLQVLEKLLPNQKQSGLGFIFGDMNYRINISLEQARKFNDKQINYKQYLQKDQMINQGELLDPFRDRFLQGTIHFPPTYKVKLDKNQYVSSRIPGWTDRIFYNKSPKLKLLSYNSDAEIFGSDHRPVIAQFTLKIQKPPLTIGEIEVRPSSRCLMF